MTAYRIYTKSNNNPRTINTPMMGRCYYNVSEVKGWEALEAKVAELMNAGERITEIRSLNNTYFVTKDGKIF